MEYYSINFILLQIITDYFGLLFETLFYSKQSSITELTVFMIRFKKKSLKSVCHGINNFILLQKRATVPPLSDALAAARSQIINYTSLVIQGLFDPDGPIPKLPHSSLFKPLMDQSNMPSGFIVDLISSTINHGWEEFKTVFTPLIQCLILEGRTSSIVESTYRPSLIALTELCDIKIQGNSRPICQLLTQMVSIEKLNCK